MYIELTLECEMLIKIISKAEKINLRFIQYSTSDVIDVKLVSYKV